MIFVIPGYDSPPRRPADLIFHDFGAIFGDFHDFGAHFGAVASLAVYRTHRLQDDSRISFFMILDLLLMILHAFGAHFCAVTSLAVYRICLFPATTRIII